MLIDKNILIKRYYQEHKTLRQIAKPFDVCHGTIISLMKKYGLKRRTHSESQIGKIISKKAKLNMSKAKLGKILSEKHKNKIRIAIKYHFTKYPERFKIGKIKGKDHPMYVDGRTLKNYHCKECGKKVTWQTGFKSTSRCSSCIKKNNKYAYINGKSCEPYSPEFNNELKEQIRKRDNYQCQNCDMTEEEHFIVLGIKLSIHHIDYDKKNCKEENLLTLCSQCNSRANFNRDYWKEFYQIKIMKISKEE